MFFSEPQVCFYRPCWLPALFYAKLSITLDLVKHDEATRWPVFPHTVPPAPPLPLPPPPLASSSWRRPGSHGPGRSEGMRLRKALLGGLFRPVRTREDFIALLNIHDIFKKNWHNWKYILQTVLRWICIHTDERTSERRRARIHTNKQVFPDVVSP